MKLKLLSSRITGSALCSLSLVFLLLLGGRAIAQQHPTGALLLNKTAYDKLPRPNWDTLRKYSNKATIGKLQPAIGASGVTMLVNPPIGDQGGEGSCVGWAVGYSATGILMYPRYNCWNVAERSPNYVFNQIRQSNCNDAYTADGLNLVVNQGDCSWNAMPYVDGACTVLPNAAQIADAGQNRALRWAALNTNDATGMKQALDLGFPVVIAFQVYPPFDNMWNTGGGIWNVPNTGASRGGHATCVIGYDDNRQMFKVQNQWGFGGDNGYFWLSYYAVQNYGLLQEVYVLYGINQASPMSVNGDNLVCGTSNTYTISNLVPGAVVTWTASPANIVTINTPTAAQTTITRQGTASAVVTLTATVTICGGPAVALPSGKITVGSLTPGPILTGPSTPYDVEVYLNDNPLAPSYNWYKGSTMMANQHSSGADIFPITCNTFTQVSVESVNACGVSARSYKSIKVPCNGGFIVSPNPAKTTVTVSVKPAAASASAKSATAGAAATFSEVRIYDFQGTLKKYQRGAATSQMSVSIAELKEGVYFIEIVSGDYTERQQLVIQK